MDEFEKSRLEYNSKQSRPSRMIDNYFENVSNNEKKDLSCEIIIELGDKEYEKIQTLSNALNNVNDELKDNKKKIKTLTKNNKSLNLRVTL